MEVVGRSKGNFFRKS